MWSTPIEINDTIISFINDTVNINDIITTIIVTDIHDIIAIVDIMFY